MGDRRVIPIYHPPARLDRVNAVDPAAQVDQPATVGAEGERRQIVQDVDGVSLRAGWAPALNHQTVPLVEPDEEVDEGVGEDDGADVPALDLPESPLVPPSPFEAPVPSDDDFSALAAFL